jgi:hypothetical protein
VLVKKVLDDYPNPKAHFGLRRQSEAAKALLPLCELLAKTKAVWRWASHRSPKAGGSSRRPENSRSVLDCRTF